MTDIIRKKLANLVKMNIPHLNGADTLCKATLNSKEDSAYQRPCLGIQCTECPFNSDNTPESILSIISILETINEQ